jgi:hypothetical protein
MTTERIIDIRTDTSGKSRRGIRQIGQAAGLRAAIILLLFLLVFTPSAPTIAQPVATLKPRPESVPLNRSVHVTLELAWTGEADVYDIPQPDTSALSEFQIVERSLSAERRGEENVVTHELVMQPLKEGEYDLGQIRVLYFEKGKDTPTLIPLPRTIVKVTPREIIPRGVLTGIMAGILSAAVGIGLYLASRKKKRLALEQEDSAQTSDKKREKFLQELSAAAMMRIEGETGDYLKKLSALADSAELGPHIEKLEELRELAENVKFGGLTPSPDQLSWAERLVKKAIEKAFPAESED